MADASPFVLPDHIQGEWSAAVLLTYTANLGFFESQLLPQLSQVPIRIVLADSERLTRHAHASEGCGRGAPAGQSHLRRKPCPAQPCGPRQSNSSARFHKGLAGSRVGEPRPRGVRKPRRVVARLRLRRCAPRTPRRVRDSSPTHRRMAAGRSIRRPVRLSSALGQPPRGWVHSHRPSTSFDTTSFARSSISSPRSATAPVRMMRVHAPFYDRELSGLDTLLTRIPTERLEVLTTRRHLDRRRRGYKPS